MLEEIKSLTQLFFQKSNISIDSIKITDNSTIKDGLKIVIYSINIQTKESSIIIGPNGKNFDSFYQVLKLIIIKKLRDLSELGENNKLKLHLEVNDYIKSKDDRLYDFIQSKVEQLKNSNTDICLPFYGAYERKKIHDHISNLNDNSIFTKSLGEGKERRLYICKQGKKLTIDIDGDDI